ncbi:MAG: hypothetical protein IPI19_15980 [Ignavibacteriales bacterium]|nr:hypothetical protein [Ignavibacteriales bacterium]
MIIGTKKQLKLEAKDGYGEYNDDAIQAVGKENFPEGFYFGSWYGIYG